MLRKEVWKGIGLLFLCHLLLVGISWAVGRTLDGTPEVTILGRWALFAVFGIGIVQLFYAIPLFFLPRSRQKVEMSQGVLIGAGITFLLNATCFASLLNPW